MAEEKKDNVWPMPMLHYKVEIGSLGEIAFKEVSGLDAEAPIIDYRHGNSWPFSTVKIPSVNYSIQLKKGVFEMNNNLFDWFNSIKQNRIQREAVTISLLDEEDNPIMVWKLTNAMPTKIIGVCIEPDGNELTVAQLDMVHDGLVIENA